MKITVLGCGTSTGVPVIGCDCDVCTSTNKKNVRTRSSVFVETDEGMNFLIDSSTDLRLQALREGITKIDAVLYTHHHADHTHGIDDLRTFNSHKDADHINCYGHEYTISHLENTFRYIFDSSVNQNGSYKVFLPKLKTVTVDKPFKVNGVLVTPLMVYHNEEGSMITYGYRIGDFAYITDCKKIPDETYELLKGLKVLILDGLRYKAHPTHLTIEEALKEASKIGATKTYLTHMGHEIEYNEALKSLNDDSVGLCYDGLVINI